MFITLGFQFRPLVFNKMLDDTNKEFIGPAEETERQAAVQQVAYEKAMKAKGAQK